MTTHASGRMPSVKSTSAKALRTADRPTTSVGAACARRTIGTAFWTKKILKKDNIGSKSGEIP